MIAHDAELLGMAREDVDASQHMDIRAMREADVMSPTAANMSQLHFGKHAFCGDPADPADAF